MIETVSHGPILSVAEVVVVGNRGSCRLLCNIVYQQDNETVTKRNLP